MNSGTLSNRERMSSLDGGLVGRRKRCQRVGAARAGSDARLSRFGEVRHPCQPSKRREKRTSRVDKREALPLAWLRLTRC